MTNQRAYDFDRNQDAKQARRMHAEDRFLGRQEVKLARAERLAETLVGRLTRDGNPVFYVNKRDRVGHYTGDTVEFPGIFGEIDAVNYLIRNNYV